jgi:hypothetical protein
VSRRIAVFAAGNAAKAVSIKKKNPKQPTDSAPGGAIHSNDVKALQAEAVRLQSQLKHEQLRAAACDEMNNVAENKFKISVRKKVGAKQ